MRKGISYLSLLLITLLMSTMAMAQPNPDEKEKSDGIETFEQRIDPKRWRMEPILNTLLYDEYAPAISTDGKTLIFQSNREGKGWNSYKLYQSTMNKAGRWTRPEPIDAINDKASGSSDNVSSGDEKSSSSPIMVAGPYLSYNSLELYFCANFDDTKGSMDIYVSRRENKDAEWGAPESVGDNINTSDYEGFPSISADGRRLYFMRRALNDEGGDDGSQNATEAGADDQEKKAVGTSEGGVFCYKFFVSKRLDDETWGEPEELPSPLNDDCSKGGRIMADGQTYYFASLKKGAKRSIRSDARDFDLFMSKMEEGGNWSDPIPADFANHLSAEGYMTMSASDGPSTIAYFNVDANASQDLYWTLVPPDFAPERVLYACGNVEDSITGEPVYVKIQFTNETRETLSFDKYNDEETGKFNTMITKGNKYKVYVEHEDYLPYEFYWDYTDEESLTNICKRVRLVPKGVEVVIKTIDYLTEEPVDASIAVKSDDDTSIDNVQRTGKGEFYARLEPKHKYEITANAEGYNEEIAELDLMDAQYGDKVEKLIEMLDENIIAFDNINFATARWDLNAQAKSELDKVYQFMMDYKKARIRIEAHTDYRGSDAYNMNLSKNRARSAYDYLVKKGIPAERLESEGYGESRPTVPNEVNGKPSQANMAINRRVEFKIVR
ncbi:MAG: OmpA family protein [Bernardetiaceae bacterium]|nr:OmpA family protein [Bernardetiaceae bacterium]